MPSRIYVPADRYRGFRFLTHADTGWRPGRDDVARLKRHEIRDVRHEVVHAEDHGGGGAGLHALAVHIQPHGKGLGIADLVRRDEPRPHRAERRAALALGPLAVPSS